MEDLAMHPVEEIVIKCEVIEISDEEEEEPKKFVQFFIQKLQIKQYLKHI